MEYTQWSILSRVHSVEYTQWSVLCGVHSVEYTLWSTLSGVHSAEYTPRSTLSRVYSVEYTQWSTLSRVHSVDYTQSSTHSVEYRVFSHLPLRFQILKYEIYSVNTDSVHNYPASLFLKFGKNPALGAGYVIKSTV